MYMKKILLAILIGAIMISCSSFSGVQGKDWKLIEIKVNDNSINFDRKTLESDNFGEIFTLKFDKENVSGAGAPNRFSAPYKVGKGNAITIQMVRATLMASIFEPQRVKESDFFAYIQNVSEWNLVDKEKLELTSKNEAGDKITLVFSL
jgi:heat shock protein HslJ